MPQVSTNTLFTALGLCLSLVSTAQTVTPVRVGSYVNTRLFNTPDAILDIIGTNSTPFINTAATFQFNPPQQACYRINPATNDTVKRYPFINISGRFGEQFGPSQHLNNNCPITSAGLILKSQNSNGTLGFFTFMNVITGSESQVNYPAWNSNPASISPYAIGGRMLLYARNANSRRVVISTDGTPAGTQELDPTIGIFSQPDYLGKHDGKIYFSVSDRSGYSVFETDGTSAGTRKILNGNSPTVELKPSKVAFSGGFIFYTTQMSKLMRCDGDSTRITEIALPFTIGPAAFASINELTAVGTSGKVVVNYRYSDFLTPANNDNGLGVASGQSNTLIRVKSVGNANPASIRLASETRDGHYLLLPFDTRDNPFIIRTTLQAGNADTLRLSSIGATANERVQQYYVWDARLLLITTPGSTNDGTMRVTDGTVAGSQTLHQGDLIRAVTVDEQGIAWYAKGLELWRLNGVPFVSTKPALAVHTLRPSPNPATNALSLNNFRAGDNLTVVNAAGQVCQVQMQRIANKLTVNVSLLPVGVYSLRSTSGGVGRFVKE